MLSTVGSLLPYVYRRYVLLTVAWHCRAPAPTARRQHEAALSLRIDFCVIIALSTFLLSEPHADPSAASSSAYRFQALPLRPSRRNTINTGRGDRTDNFDTSPVKNEVVSSNLLLSLLRTSSLQCDMQKAGVRRVATEGLPTAMPTKERHSSMTCIRSFSCWQAGVATR